jgi:hypothetical protein
MTTTTRTTTQQQHPLRAAARTFIAVILPSLLTALLVLPEVIDAVLDVPLPDGLRVWLVGAAGVLASVSAVVTRIMAIPAVDAFLDRLRLSSAPVSADGVPDITSLTPDERAVVNDVRAIEGRAPLPDTSHDG